MENENIFKTNHNINKADESAYNVSLSIERLKLKNKNIFIKKKKMKSKKLIYWLVLAIYTIPVANLIAWKLDKSKFYWFSWVIIGFAAFMLIVQVIALRQDKKNIITHG